MVTPAVWTCHGPFLSSFRPGSFCWTSQSLFHMLIWISITFLYVTGPELYTHVSLRLCRRALIVSCHFIPVHPWACFVTSLLLPLLCGEKAMWHWLWLDSSTGNYYWTLQNQNVHPNASSAISLNSYAKCLSWSAFTSNTPCQDSWSHNQWPTSNALQLVLWQHHNATEVSGELNQRRKNGVWHFGTCHHLKIHHTSSRALSKWWWKTFCMPEFLPTERLLCCALGTLPPFSCHPSQLETRALCHTVTLCWSTVAAGDGSPGHQARPSPLWAAKPPACPTVAVLSQLYGCEEITVGVEASQWDSVIK